MTTEQPKPTPCVNHPQREAIMRDLDAEGRDVPLCEVCYHQRRAAIMRRLLGQGLITGGVRG